LTRTGGLTMIRRPAALMGRRFRMA